MTRCASLALATLMALAGCGDSDPAARVADGLARVVASARPTDLTLLLIGIDGASFRLIDPLLAEGRLPAFAGLVERGAHGPLLSQRPMNSPAIWTTVATGFNRQRHGIGGFSRTEVSGETPRKRMVSSLDRKTLALWNLLGPFQKSVGVVAWWASWPAEPVRGWIVSDRMARGRWSEWLDAERAGGLTYPPELAARLAPLVVDPSIQCRILGDETAALSNDPFENLMWDLALRRSEQPASSSDAHSTAQLLSPQQEEHPALGIDELENPHDERREQAVE